MKDTSVRVYMTTSEYNELKELSKEMGVSLSSVSLIAIKKYIKNYNGK